MPMKNEELAVDGLVWVFQAIVFAPADSFAACVLSRQRTLLPGVQKPAPDALRAKDVVLVKVFEPCCEPWLIFMPVGAVQPVVEALDSLAYVSTAVVQAIIFIDWIGTEPV
jgi:hypothetical protein